MKQIACLVVVWLLTGITAAVSASELSSCTDGSLSEVRTLAGLPSKVNLLLGQTTTGLEGIADRDEKFNVTDVIDERLPMRRFIIAGINPTCSLVALEHGGRGYSIELVVIELSSKQWQVTQRRIIRTKPQSVHELARYLK